MTLLKAGPQEPSAQAGRYAGMCYTSRLFLYFDQGCMDMHKKQALTCMLPATFGQNVSPFHNLSWQVCARVWSCLHMVPHIS